MIIETRAVLAGAYRGKMRRTLTHSVEIDGNLVEVRVLCGNVALDSLCDRLCSDPHAPPSCVKCRKRISRRRNEP